MTAPDPFAIDSLMQRGFGENNLPSPLKESFGTEAFVDEEKDRVLLDVRLQTVAQSFTTNRQGEVLLLPQSLEVAGPRLHLYWRPEHLKVGIVTCGGIAPGLNNVIQNMVHVLWERYQVTHIFGIPFGYHGFTHDSHTKRFLFAWRRLDPTVVQNIDFEAGSILGSGRGHSEVPQIVDALQMRGVQILFTIGGDGTLRGALAIQEEIQKRNLPIAIVGIPKTIDNDVLYVSKSFGFETAVSKALEALRCAQSEARGAFNGVGLVKLMGRNSGALTAMASAAMSDIDFVLIPEITIQLEGPNGFLQKLFERVIHKGNAVIAVAEGTGQELFEKTSHKDASGNAALQDIGLLLKQRILEYFKRKQMEVNLKYIDPSYMLRAQPTSADDSVFCQNLAHNAVHAAMAGKTGLMVGYTHETFTHVPLSQVCTGKKRFDTSSQTWRSVLATTGQPSVWL